VSRARVVALGAAVGVVVMAWVTLVPLLGGDRAPGFETAAGAATYRYVIPDGTGELMDRGAEVTILPEALTAYVGETIQIVNDDERGHVVGPFYVGAGQTLTQRLTSPGELAGLCTVHPDGRFVLRVLP